LIIMDVFVNYKPCHLTIFEMQEIKHGCQGITGLHCESNSRLAGL
jgi:hypothetical protein